MRYYDLTITNPNGQSYVPSPTGEGFTLGTGSTFSSLVRPGGPTDPNALNIELDIPVSPFHQAQGGSRISVWGIGLRMMAQQNLSQSLFTLKAGMAAGLPLANPAQQGIIAKGIIWQAFGNWKGTTQTLDFVCNPGNLDPKSSGAISFSWPPGTSLQTAVTSALTAAFPSFGTPTWEVGATLSNAGVDQYAFHQESLTRFSIALNNLTRPLGQKQISPFYPGLQVAVRGPNELVVTDFRASVKPITQLAPQDLIGQPTWIGYSAISFETVMRGDLDYGDKVQFPTGVIAPYALTTPAAAQPGSPARSKTVFQGAFQINEIHHWGNSRQPDADSWVTVYTALALGT